MKVKPKIISKVNPYEFTGPLDPDAHHITSSKRTREIQKVIRGIRRGDYWSILGPRQIGKTTFLFQLSKELSAGPFICIYIDLEIGATDQEMFYEIMINEIIEKVPPEIVPPDREQWKKLGPKYYFYNFLKNLKAPENTTVVFLLDEIARVDSIKSFLELWRKVFHERRYYPELKKYSVVIAGAEDIVALTMGRSSPFNISKKIFLSNLEQDECQHLVQHPMEQLNARFTPGARDELMTKVSGHPQLLQHLCYLLVEKFSGESPLIDTADVEEAVETLFKNNDNLETLEHQVNRDPELLALVTRMLQGERVKYLGKHKYSTAGSGPVIEDENGYCRFRSVLYREYLDRIMEFDAAPLDAGPTEIITAPEFNTTVYCHQEPRVFDSIKQESDFLAGLFNEKISITVGKNGMDAQKITLSPRERLFFCYLAYKNYKAMNEGFSGWEAIPPSYKYRVSSIHENNEIQEPEWGVFKQALRKIDVQHIGDGIKAWACSIRRKLDRVNARELIHSETGRGSGYILKGKVNFAEFKETAS